MAIAILGKSSVINWCKHLKCTRFLISCILIKFFTFGINITIMQTFHVFGACQEPTKKCMPLNFSFSMLLRTRNFVQPQSGMNWLSSQQYLPHGCKTKNILLTPKNAQASYHFWHWRSVHKQIKQSFSCMVKTAKCDRTKRQKGLTIKIWPPILLAATTYRYMLLFQTNVQLCFCL